MFRPCLAAAIALTGTAALADADAMRAYVEDNVRAWATAPAIIDSIRAANRRHRALSEDDIQALDAKWRAELGQTERATIDPVVTAPASEALREHVAQTGGVVTEVIVMDAVGLNVAISHLTSDYWQGDEAKFAETAGTGGAAMHVSEIDFDESSQTYQAQVSFTVLDPEGGAPLGAVTIGLDAEAF